MRCFESRAETGGQWAQQPDVCVDAPAEVILSSMYDGVVLNSCRDTSALPDFLIDPARYGDYYSHRLQLRYLRKYAEHSGLEKHIRLRTKVVACESRRAGAGAGGWAVKVKRSGEEEGEESEYDVVFVCTGHVSPPSTPYFTGRDTFQSQFWHSHYYRRAPRRECGCYCGTC